MSDRRSVLILLVLLTGIIMLIFGDVFLHPNSYLFGISGDGIKNYFTFAWYVIYDSGLHFSGMNYPFGEHIVYTDNQPLFSVPLHLVHKYLFPLNNHIFGIINGIIFCSMLAAAVVLYFILRKCLLPAWYAITGAILIVLLSPQHYFISQQYALTNTLVLPAIWLTVIRVFESPNNYKRYGWYILIMVAAGFVHPYFLAIGALLFLGYWLWHAFQRKWGWPQTWLQLSRLLLCGIFPLLLFKLFLFLTDTVTDRPDNPRHVLEGKANLAGLFYPLNSFSSWLLETISRTKVPIEENHGYIGLAALLCLALMAAKSIRHVFRLKFRKLYAPTLPAPLRGGLWAGLLILFFAMAIPFQFGLSYWLDYVPALKQFRFTSRFTWMFYYIFATYGVFFIFQVYRYCSIKNRKALAYSWLTLMLFIWGSEAFRLLRVEAAILHMQKKGAVFTGKEENISALLRHANRSPNDFQMIIPVPYYSDGSEKIGDRNWGETMYQSMRVAYQTGLPISTAALSRSSLKQTLLRTQLLGSDSIKKEILPFLPSRKPILVVVTGAAEKAYEKRLLQKSRFLTRHKNISFYELPIAALEKIYHDPVKPAALNLDAIPDKVVYQTFANNPSEKGLFRKGAFVAENGPAVLFNDTLPNASGGFSYEFSIWVNAKAAIGMPVIKLEEYNERNETINQEIVNLRGTTEIYRDWLKATVYFKLKAPENRIKITVDGKGIVADELLIRPLNQEFYFYAEDRQQLIRNNYPVY